MIINFNRQTGKILELSESLDSFNTKTMRIKDVSLIKYISLNNLAKISKKDRLDKSLFIYNNKETSILKKVPEVEKGDSIFKEGNIEFFTNRSDKTIDLSEVKIYDTIGKYVSFPKQFNYFTIDEIMREHYQILLEESDCHYGLADNFSYLKNILIGESTFKTIEDREIILAPGNELKLKSELLNSKANVFKILDINRDITIYINNTELDSILELQRPIDKINISFKNNTNRDVVLDSFMIGYFLQE